MKRFLTPEMKIVKFSVEDIVTTSGRADEFEILPVGEEFDVSPVGE